MKFTVAVTQSVVVELDEAKFDDAFMAEFRESFFPFSDIEDHAKHIAQLEARGLLDPDFTEGYGPLSDMGITAEVVDAYEELEP